MDQFFKNIIFCSVCIFVIILFSSTVANARVVVVVHDSSVDSTSEEIKRMAISKALVMDIEEYLAQRIPDTRRDVIIRYFSSLSQGFVSNVQELESIAFDNGKTKSTFDVFIREKTLQTLLREFGVPYTINSLQPYILNVASHNMSINYGKIAMLEKVTGVVQQKLPQDKSTTVPVVTLVFDGGMWSGELEYGVNAQTFSATGISFDTVWRGMWGQFFSYKQTREESVSKGYILKVWGWRSGAGVEELSGKLNHWASNIKNVMLQEISMDKGKVSAQWLIEITDKNAFEVQIGDYAIAHKLMYAIQEDEGIESSIENTVEHKIN